MKSEIRKRQIESVICQALGRFLLDYNDQRVVKFINLTQVCVSPDLAYAKVYYSLLDSGINKVEAEEFFKQEGFKLRRRLAAGVNLRVTPQLRFIFDDTEERAWALDRLIDQAIGNADN